jgi:hypothetical protein
MLRAPQFDSVNSEKYDKSLFAILCHDNSMPEKICTLHGVIFEFFRIILNFVSSERPSCLESRENNRDI